LLTGKGRAHHGDILREATKLAEDGKLKLLLDPRNLTLQTVNDAYHAIESGTAQGKIVVDISGEILQKTRDGAGMTGRMNLYAVGTALV
jgi:NADPH2:quinone reductase